VKTLSQLFILIIASVVIGLGLNAASKKPLPLIAGPEQFVEEVPEGMSVERTEIMALWESGEATFIDARSAEMFAEGHILGAISLPYELFDEGDPGEALEWLPLDRTLVVYCDGADCDASHVVAESLLDYGFEEQYIRIFAGGWTEWLEMGGEVGTGEE